VAKKSKNDFVVELFITKDGYATMSTQSVVNSCRGDDKNPELINEDSCKIFWVDENLKELQEQEALPPEQRKKPKMERIDKKK